MGKQFEDVKVLSTPFLSGRLGEEKRIKILEAITKAAYVKAGRAEANDVCLVQDLDSESPDPFTLVVPAIMKSELEKNYPNGKYVGKCFRFTRFAKAEGGKASPVAVYEIKAKL